MMQVNRILPTSFKAAEYTTSVKENRKETAYDNELSSKYLQNLAMQNIPAVKKVDLASKVQAPYQNHLRSRIQNNETETLAIEPRIFTAEDLNGDDKITFALGEKNGTFLSAISRLDELKKDGINNIHILPIHPMGRKNAQGTAGSLYSPAKYVTDDGH